MLGEGGEIVHPHSESEELLKVWRLLEAASQEAKNGFDVGARLSDAMERLRRLYEQVRRGYHRNPTLVIHNPPLTGARRTGQFEAGRVVAKLSEDVHEVRYTHFDDGEDYRHEFEGDVEMFCVLRAGRRDVLLSHREGKPLWDDFVV